MIKVIVFYLIINFAIMSYNNVVFNQNITLNANRDEIWHRIDNRVSIILTNSDFKLQAPLDG